MGLKKLWGIENPKICWGVFEKFKTKFWTFWLVGKSPDWRFSPLGWMFPEKLKPKIFWYGMFVREIYFSLAHFTGSFKKS